jgi:hypothetical protein
LRDFWLGAAARFDRSCVAKRRRSAPITLTVVGERFAGVVEFSAGRRTARS